MDPGEGCERVSAAARSLSPRIPPGSGPPQSNVHGVSAFWPQRRKKEDEEPPWVVELPQLHWALRLALAVLPFLLSTGLVFGLIALGRHFAEPHEAQRQLPLASALGGHPASPTPGASSFDTAPFIAAGALVGFALLVAVAFWLRRGRTPLPLRDRTLAERLSDVLGESLDDLLAEPDARRAVIAAYARMERALGSFGLPRRLYEAPLEYLSRVLLELQASALSVRRLTDLFERAKFSPHEVDAEMKGVAVEALSAVRDELRGAQ